MGDIADNHVDNYSSGRWGSPNPPARAQETTTKAAIAGNRFSIVEVLVGRTNRTPGTKLIVCDRNEQFYWVWASGGVTGIAKDVCRVLQADLALKDALAALGRKSYVSK